MIGCRGNSNDSKRGLLGDSALAVLLPLDLVSQMRFYLLAIEAFIVLRRMSDMSHYEPLWHVTDSFVLLEDVESLRPGIILRIKVVVHSVNKDGDLTATFLYELKLRSRDAILERLVVVHADRVTQRPHVRGVGLGEVHGEEGGMIRKLASVLVDAFHLLAEGGSGNRSCHYDSELLILLHNITMQEMQK